MFPREAPIKFTAPRRHPRIKRAERLQRHDALLGAIPHTPEVQAQVLTSPDASHPLGVPFKSVFFFFFFFFFFFSERTDSSFFFFFFFFFFPVSAGIRR